MQRLAIATFQRRVRLGGADAGNGEAGRCGCSSYHAVRAGGKKDRRYARLLSTRSRCDFWLLSRIFRRLVGYYDPPTIHQRDIHISETNLYDLTENQLVWSGTVQTVDPSDINKEIKRYVDTVIEALKSKNLLPSK